MSFQQRRFTSFKTQQYIIFQQSFPFPHLAVVVCLLFFFVSPNVKAEISKFQISDR